MQLTDDEKRQIDKMSRAGESVTAIADFLGVPPKEVRKYIQKAAKERAGKLPTAVFFIGLALLFIPGTGLAFWPGILFVFAATALASGLAEGHLGNGLQGAIWLTAIGLIFTVGFSLPLILILIGLSSLLGFLFRPGVGQPRRDEAEKKDDWKDELRDGLREAGRAIREGFQEAGYEKRKNEERRYRAREEDRDDRDYEKPKRGAMRLSDDGELIDIVDDEEGDRRDMRRT